MNPAINIFHYTYVECNLVFDFFYKLQKNILAKYEVKIMVTIKNVVKKELNYSDFSSFWESVL